MNRSVYKLCLSVILSGSIMTSGIIALASPPPNPPNNNTPLPIYIDNSYQIKDGRLELGNGFNPGSPCWPDCTGLKVLNGSVGIGIGTNTPSQLLHSSNFVRTDNGLCLPDGSDPGMADDCLTSWPSRLNAVIAGSGLTGGGISGDVTLHVGGTTGITVGTNSISLTNTSFDCGGQYIQGYNIANGSVTCGTPYIQSSYYAESTYYSESTYYNQGGYGYNQGGYGYNQGGYGYNQGGYGGGGGGGGHHAYCFAGPCTTGYIPKWTYTDNLNFVELNNSALYDNNGSICINLTNCTAPLHVNSFAGYGISFATSSAGITIGNGPSRALQINGGAYGVYDMATRSYFAGNVGIKTTNPASELHVEGNIRFRPGSFGSQNICYLSSGDGTKNLHPCSSLQVLKTDIKDLELGLETVMKLQPREYVWKETGGRDLGFIAEEVEELDPLLAEYDNEKLISVKYDHMVALLTKAMQERQRMIEYAREEINELRNKLFLEDLSI